jgi:hypothetical protein
MADNLLCIFGHQGFQFRLGFFVLEISRLGPSKDCGKLRPGVGRADINDAHSLDRRPRRFDPEQARGLSVLDTAPELSLGRDEKVLVQRIAEPVEPERQ